MSTPNTVTKSENTGNDAVVLSYSDLLKKAYERDLVSMDVEILSTPSPMNDYLALCRVTCETATGGSVSNVSGVSADTGNTRNSAHLISRAATLARIRCLKDLTCEDATIREEIEITKKNRLLQFGKACLKVITPSTKKNIMKEEMLCRY